MGKNNPISILVQGPVYLRAGPATMGKAEKDMNAASEHSLK